MCCLQYLSPTWSWKHNNFCSLLLCVDQCYQTIDLPYSHQLQRLGGLSGGPPDEKTFSFAKLSSGQWKLGEKVQHVEEKQTKWKPSKARKQQLQSVHVLQEVPVWPAHHPRVFGRESSCCAECTGASVSLWMGLNDLHSHGGHASKVQTTNPSSSNAKLSRYSIRVPIKWSNNLNLRGTLAEKC